MNITTYSYTYIIIIVIYFAMSLLSSNVYLTKRQVSYVVLSFVVVTGLLSACRPDALPDTSNYVIAYNDSVGIFNVVDKGNVSELLFNRTFHSMEVVFLLYMALIHKAMVPCRLFFGITSVLISLLFFQGMKLCLEYIAGDEERETISSQYISLWFVFFSIYGILYTTVSLRAGLAMGLGICFIGYMLNRKKRGLAVVLLVCALLVHSTAITYVLIYAILLCSPQWLKKKQCGLLAGLGTVCYTLNFSGVFSYIFVKVIVILFSILGINAFGSYLESIDYLFRLKVLFVIVCVSALLVISFIPQKACSRLAVLVIIGIFILALLSGIPSISREADMFIVFLVPMIAFSLMSNNRLEYGIVVKGIALLMFIPQYLMIFVNAS